jgi:transposase
MSSICILDENGRRVKRQTVHGFWPKVLAELRKVAEPFEICFEASCAYGYLYDQLQRIARRVVVAHPGQLRLIFRSKRKNDRVDAEKLAKLLYLGEVPAAYVPSIDVRSWRRLVEYRRRLIDKQTRCKNAIRALLRSHGIQAPKGLWTRKAHAWLTGLEWPNLAAEVQRDLLADELALFQRQIRTVTKALDKMNSRHPAVVLLRTIPGVGARTAETIAAYVDDPSRFSRCGEVASYFGLVPCQDSSAGLNRLGHITKQGPPTARKYLVEATWQAVRRSPTVRAYFKRICDEKPERRKVALVATAHYLLRCMWAMLRSGEAWHEAA